MFTWWMYCRPSRVEGKGVLLRREGVLLWHFIEMCRRVAFDISSFFNFYFTVKYGCVAPFFYTALFFLPLFRGPLICFDLKSLEREWGGGGQGSVFPGE